MLARELVAAIEKEVGAGSYAKVKFLDPGRVATIEVSSIKGSGDGQILYVELEEVLVRPRTPSEPADLGESLERILLQGELKYFRKNMYPPLSRALRELLNVNFQIPGIWFIWHARRDQTIEEYW